MISSKKSALFVFALAVLGLLLGGCTTNTPKQSSIPWSKPADWEGQIPGMGQPTGR